MNILSLENISKSYSERPLLDQTSFFLQEGDKVGIVGVNGTGKSTLLKIAAGLEEPDAGSRITASHAVIQYLPQMPEFPADMTIIEHVRAVMQKAVSWDMEGEVRAMLDRLEIWDLQQKIGELSGGQRKRLALAEVLLKPCDILILDEPTNHLDLWMAEWLENYLKGYRGSLIMVTHDRYFLDSVSNRIVEVDKGKIYNYDAGYSGFLELKQEREEMAQAAERKRQSLLRVELEWVRRGARARSTKQKAHLQRYENLKNQSGPVQDRQVEMDSVSSRMGNTTIEIRNLCKSYGDRTLIRDFSYIFLKHDRIGFVGHNGCGKTTLMKMLVGALQPDSGEILVGQTIKIGYYSQEVTFDPSRKTGNKADAAYMDPEQRVIDYIRDTAEYVRTKDGLISASAMLERFLFPPEEQYSRIGKLSGGERRRLNLLRVLMEAPNVLILDEPTNDLDITTLTILEDYLDRFSGIVITVSHDRYFLDRVVRRIFAFEENGRLVQYEGGYTDYQRKAGEKALMDTGRDTGASHRAGSGSGGQITDADGHVLSGKAAYQAQKKQEKKLKFSYQEQREYDTIEEEIAALEEKMEQLDAEMAHHASDYPKLRELTEEKEKTEAALTQKMERWEYLEELAEKIAAQNTSA